MSRDSEGPGPAAGALDMALSGSKARIRPLAEGRTGPVLRVEIEGGETLVAKLDESGTGGLPTEAEGLRRMEAAGVPVPTLRIASRHLLLMTWCPGSDGVSAEAAEHAAGALHTLHAVTDEYFGYPTDTRVGGLLQPNPRRVRWLDFFAEARLLHASRLARDEGRIDQATLALVERVVARLPELAEEPRRPALLHGDLWAGNVRSEGSRLTALLDPAVYFGHPEVDLAFATMFGGFAARFFDAYRARAAAVEPGLLDADFWRTRRELWNLYPLLVHVRLFGGSYVDDLRAAARRLG